MKWLGWMAVRTLLVVLWFSTCLGQNMNLHTANKRQVDPLLYEYILGGGEVVRPSNFRNIDEEQNEPGFILPDDDYQPDETVDKRVLSSFRERMEKQKEQNDYAKWAEPFLRDYEKEMGNIRIDDESNRNFERFLNELWEEYKASTRNGYGYETPKVYRAFGETYRKRREPDYPSLGWAGVGYRKRGGPRFDDDITRGYQIRRRQLRRNYYEIPDDVLYANKEKRNVVSKRSSNYYANHHKRSNKEQIDKKNIKKEQDREHVSGTDPKIMKDLKSLFDVKEASNKTNEIEIKKPVVVENKSDTEHLNIKKKSLDWSNYFGYDRRKKSNNDIDEEWLMERYRNALSAAKRTTEYPLKYFKNHDDLDEAKKKKDESPDNKKPEEEKTNEAKLIEMDTKLKNIEDLIIDEALKYTGAHEGTTDSKQIQEIKDKVISRLAAAYSLEKMRKALGEFKNSIAAQKNAIQSNDVNEFDEEQKKRGNDISEKDKKFAEKKEAFHSGNELNFDDNQRSIMTNPISGVSDLEILDRRCRSLALSVSDHNDFFYPLCKWHQTCTVCSSEVYSKSPTHCDILFFSKAYELCEGEPMCQWSARPALEYLKDAAEEQPIDRISICNQIDDPYKLIR